MIMITTIGNTGISGLTILNPSTAEEIDIAGVIKPSAIKVEQPIRAGRITHLRLFFNKANKAKIPPSPLLSAFNAKYIYLMDAIKINVQITADKPPKISPSLKTVPPPVIA